MGDIPQPVYLGVGMVLLYYLYGKIALYWSRSRFKKANGCLPVKKYKQFEEILGLQYYLKRIQLVKNNTILQSGAARFHKYGYTHNVKVMGSNVFLTIEPENVKAVLSSNFKDYGLGGRQKTFGVLMGAGIFTTDGVQWEHSRSIVRPTFKKTQIADLPIFETHIQHLIENIPRGQIVDLQPLFFRLTIDNVTEFLLGESTNLLSRGNQPPSKDFSYQFDYAQNGLMNRFLLGKLCWLYRDKKFYQACAFCHAYVDKFVAQSLERHKAAQESGKAAGERKQPQRYVFIDEMVKETQDPITLRYELLNVMTAGRDTTASLLSNLFVALAKHPHVWEKLQAEVRELKGEIPDYEHLRGMKYVRHVLNESLRLHPILPSNAREAVRDTILPLGGGPAGTSPVFIPKNARVSFTTYVMHRRQDIWGPDADDFNPDRWETARPGWGYIPFNGGPRICPGQQYALTVASYAVVRLCQTFATIADGDERPWNGRTQLIMSSLWGTKVRLG